MQLKVIYNWHGDIINNKMYAYNEIDLIQLDFSELMKYNNELHIAIKLNLLLKNKLIEIYVKLIEISFLYL